MNNEEELPFCECGECGLRVTKKGNRFITGHNRRGKVNSPEHNAAISRSHIDITHTPETCATMSRVHTGVSLSPEHIAARTKGQKGKSRIPRTPEQCDEMSNTMRNSDKHKAAMYKFCGGYDIIMHHYLYDDADLSKYTMSMTRAEHTRMHNYMREDGYEVTHINSREDDNGLWGYH